MEMAERASEGKNPSVDAQREYWDDRWEEQKSPNAWQSHRGEAILAMIGDLDLDSPRILDLGCATGWMTNMLSEFGHAEGVDLSESAVEIAKAKFPGIQFTAGDLYEISLTSEPVDLVVCQEVISHVSDQEVLIRRIADVIKPGGYLLITAGNKFVMDRVRDSDGLVGVGDADPEDHIKKWLDMKSFKRLLSTQFTVVRTTSTIPIGIHGWLRLINSHKLNSLASLIIPPSRLEALKERMGFGYSLIALGRKKS